MFVKFLLRPKKIILLFPETWPRKIGSVGVFFFFKKKKKIFSVEFVYYFNT